jgi:diaminohydroxyphosphoribosylaminopyrimidine deaminase/5-amino-6-(5-phosphoribosylamino)uracil reductase
VEVTKVQPQRAEAVRYGLPFNSEFYHPECLLNRSLFTPPARELAAGHPPEVEDPGESWRMVPEIFRGLAETMPSPFEDVFGPLRIGAVDDLVVVGQVGQSLDGRAATWTGHSRYINGAAGLTHLHRLRALVDAVIVGVGSAIADDPQLTVRHVAGPAPARVVIDPRGRLSSSARLFADDGVRRIVVTARGTRCALDDVDVLSLPASGGHIEPAYILAGLAGMGLRRVLVEGGADTLSRFLKAGCLDRLHVIVAPIFLGGGRPGFMLNAIDRVDQALRPPMRVHRLEGEILFDCDFSGATHAGRRREEITLVGPGVRAILSRDGPDRPRE